MLVVAACNDGVEHMYVFQLLIKVYRVVLAYVCFLVMS